jgi:hypothetical protein
MGTHCSKQRACSDFKEPTFFAPCAAPSIAMAVPMFHGDRARTGWYATETTLTPSAVSGPSFGPVWSSAELDEETLEGNPYRPHLYGSPLYLDGVTLGIAPYAGRTLSVLFVGSTNGWAYAVNAFTSCGAPTIPAGTILWRTRLAPPARVNFDGGVLLGVLSTPVLDVDQKRIYLASLDAASGWNAYALDLATGAPVGGWPVTLDARAVATLDVNGPAVFDDAKVISQRGALNLSQDGGLLYVPFGAYNDGGIGWLVVVDTRRASLATSFSSARSTEHVANGGMWAPAGRRWIPRATCTTRRETARTVRRARRGRGATHSCGSRQGPLSRSREPTRRGTTASSTPPTSTSEAARRWCFPISIPR